MHLACVFFLPAIVRHWASKMPCGRSASYTNTRRQGSTSHMWMHAASDARFQEKDEGFRIFCARLQARMVRGMPENDAYVGAGLSIVSNCTRPFVLSLSLCLEALKHPVKRKICEEPKLDTYVREARHVTFSLFACRLVTLSLELSTCQLVSVVHAKRFLSSKPAMPGSLYQ